MIGTMRSKRSPSTFLQADAARAASAPGRRPTCAATSTTDGRIEGLIREAERLRQAYHVPTGFQRAPFFEFRPIALRSWRSTRAFCRPSTTSRRPG